MVTATACDPVRYFLTIGLHPRYALVLLCVVTAIGVGTTWIDPKELDAGLGMILFAQMFLASSGFAGRARRGHFDPLLIDGGRRVRTAAAHCLVSILPGVTAWLLLAVVAVIARAPAALSAFAGSRAAALTIVSALSWAAGFWLPRGAAGMLWMALLMLLVLQRADLLAVPAGSGAFAAVALHAATLTVCPFLLLGQHPPLAPGAVPGAMVLPILLVWSMWRHSRALDVYLRDPS
jgi:hypothetical protein